MAKSDEEAQRVVLDYLLGEAQIVAKDLKLDSTVGLMLRGARSMIEGRQVRVAKPRTNGVSHPQEPFKGQSVGEIISNAREAKGLDREALGEKIGLSAAAVYRWENDDNLPGPKVAPKLAKVLGVDVAIIRPPAP